MQIDPITSLAFSIFENKGVYALLLGSGISRAAFIPTGWEITLDLIRRIAEAQGEENQPDWDNWYREKYGTSPSYSDLLDRLSGTADERRAILHGYIEPTADDRERGRKVPTNAHRAIAKLVRGGYIKVILATNFDRLIENALREEGIEPTVVSNADNARGAIPLPHNQCFVLKLHGDYLDTRTLNTEAELAKYPVEINKLLDRIFDEYGLIVCGWSGDWDPALRAAISRASNRRYQTCWTIRQDPSGLAADLIKHRAARTIKISSADQFFEKLAQQVTRIAETRQLTPESIELAVQAAKKFIARSEHRVELHDLVKNEVLRTIQLRENSLASQFDPPAPQAEAFTRTIERLEGSTETLVRIFGVLGRHGDGMERQFVLDCLRDLARVDLSHSSQILRRYPTLLATVSYCLGAAKALRYDAMFDLLMLSIPEIGMEEPLVTHLSRLQQDVEWRKVLPGLSQKKVALSEHLLARFASWASDYSFGRTDTEHLLSIWEVLVALAYYSVRHTAAEMKNQNASRTPIWAPAGRLVYLEDERSRLLNQLSIAPMRDQLLKVGFCRSDPVHFDESLKAFAAFLERVSYS